MHSGECSHTIRRKAWRCLMWDLDHGVTAMCDTKRSSSWRHWVMVGLVHLCRCRWDFDLLQPAEWWADLNHFKCLLSLSMGSRNFSWHLSENCRPSGGPEFTLWWCALQTVFWSSDYNVIRKSVQGSPLRTESMSISSIFVKTHGANERLNGRIWN